ncbi:MAG: 4Fe-4S ferredoxin [Deltaproteobacteria bacterium SG8_13]|nr:MAG: 4Fe-4S ferredoxin [Deltaproteobacteria bacterium SG8_13]
MRIVTARRISQVFFTVVFLWFCVVTSLGDAWWQLRGWPVNWLIELDPLVGLATLLATGSLYAGLLWGLVTVVLTVVLGRFFCGWVCPFGAMHQFLGYLGKKGKTPGERIERNRFNRWQRLKYWILIFLLAPAVADLLSFALRIPLHSPRLFWPAIGIGLAAAAALAAGKVIRRSPRWVLGLAALTAVWTAAGYLIETDRLFFASVQVGLLDPMPLVYRSVNLILMPLVDRTAIGLSVVPRLYSGSWLIAGIFFAALLLNFRQPRFYCRYICPLGALFGVLGRYSLWRIGKQETECRDCLMCDRDCEGACTPSGTIRTHECVLCMNCMSDCRHNQIGYRTVPSAAGEMDTPDITRRQLVLITLTGVAGIPALRLGGYLEGNWNPQLVRPPAALPERQFLERCIKCGQCMRICPTNVIQPAGLEAGLEGLWTPVLNFRIGTSGCQHKCIACGHVCPTAAIRPIDLQERTGQGRFASAGPLRIGTAFIDRGRCLPWAMTTPCIVCQENCPVSPKAIVTRQVFERVQVPGSLIAGTADPLRIELDQPALPAGRFGTGDFYCLIAGQNDAEARQIVGNTANEVTVQADRPWQVPPPAGSRLEILIRLQQPSVKPELCIGCGVCEHECPVRGKRAIRVTAENESRNRRHALLLKT